MLDLPSVTNLTNSPPGQLVAGAALAGIVWKFFERVEAVLTDQTKFEVAVWLVGVGLGKKVERWPETFATIFDRVFGTEHFSWKCFWRSCLASYAIVVLFALNIVRQLGHDVHIAGMDGVNVVVVVTLFFTGFCNVIPDYISLLETRLVLRFMKRSTSVLYPGFLMVDLILTVLVASGATLLGGYVMLRFLPLDVLHALPHNAATGQSDIHLRDFLAMVGVVRAQPEGILTSISFVGEKATIKILSPAVLAGMWFYPAFFTSIWLWLYAGSGFLLKFARRFDIGFDWFNRKFDIEKKPLSAIGLVAGSLVAFLYRSWAAFRHFVPA